MLYSRNANRLQLMLITGDFEHGNLKIKNVVVNVMKKYLISKF